MKKKIKSVNEIMRMKMKSVNGLATQVDKFEKTLISHQQETEKRKKIKTEEAINYRENQRVAHLEEIMELKLHRWMDKETIKEITRKNAEANQMVEELSRKLSACEDAKKTSDWIQEDLRRKNLEADRKVQELGGRVSALEEEKTDSKRRLEGLEGQNVETDKRMKEMKVRESDLRRQILEARKAVEVNIKRFENVLPIAEDLWKLLKMNVDDLVSAKDKFVCRGAGLISSSVDSRNGATTKNGEAGPHPSNKAVELAVSATEQPTKKPKIHNKT